MVSLRDSGLGPLSGAAVAAMLNTHRCSILDLCGNLIRDQGASALAEMMVRNKSLTRLDLRSNDIGIDGAAMVFEALLQNSTLTDLDMGAVVTGGGSRNRLGLKAVTNLSSALETNRSLMFLSLYGCGMGSHCCSVFAKGLSQNTTIKRLNLGLNQTQDEGVIKICEAVELGGCIEQLNLSHNGISNNGGTCISTAIGKCQILLQTLDLSNNKLGAKAATALGFALSCNSVLSTLQLEYNDIGIQGGVAIAQGLSQNHH